MKRIILIGLFCLVACKKKASESTPVETTPPPAPLADARVAATARPTDAAVALAPPKPVVGQAAIDKIEACLDLVNAGKLDELETSCLRTGYKAHVVDVIELANSKVVIDQLKRLRTAFPDLKLTPHVILVGEWHQVAMTILLTGTQDGALEMPGAPALAATHKKVGVLSYVGFQFDATTGTMSEQWIYTDPSTLLAQIGQAPDGAPPKRAAIATTSPTQTAVTAGGLPAFNAAETVQRGNVAFNARKLADLTANLTSDVVVSDQTLADDVIGAKAVESDIKKLQDKLPDAMVTPCPSDDGNCWSLFNGSNRKTWITTAGDFVGSSGLI